MTQEKKLQITLVFYDKEGDVCYLDCYNREDACRQADALFLVDNIEVRCWFFRPGEELTEEFYETVEYFNMEELRAN